MLKILLYIFLLNYASFWAICSNAAADTNQNTLPQDTRELIELGKYKEAEEVIILQLDQKPRDAQWRYLQALLKAELGLSSQNIDDLNNLVKKIASKISSNSQESIKAFKDLYNLSQDGLGMDDALKAEFEKEYPDIKDTNERLSEFK